MATVPAPVPAQAPAPAQAIDAPPLDSGDLDLTSESMQTERGNDFLEGFNKLDIIRQVGLMVGLAASVAIGFSVVLWSQSKDYQPVYGSMDGFDVSEVMNILNNEGIDYTIEPKTGVLLVPTEIVANARLKLAAAGLSRDDGLGYEILDQEQGLGTSQFMESTRYIRGLEGELVRTITSIHSVHSARVHLAIPKRSVFIRNSRKPSASVFLNLFAGKRLTDEQVSAISNLVASSIPELKVKNVTLVDQKGRLLSKKDDDSGLAIAGKQYDYTRKIEDLLVERVGRILQPVVGEAGFKAEVTADIDFTVSEQTDEIYNPDLPALRSEQTLDERRSGATLNGAIPGALSNQPPVDAQVPEVAGGEAGGVGKKMPRNSRLQSTKNYELDRTISHTKHQVGTILRLSVAVVMDDYGAGTGKSRPWTEDELARITTLVKDAVGFNAMRGDSVNVINAAFAAIAGDVYEEVALWKQPWVATASKKVLGGLFIFLLVFGLLRPVLKNLATLGMENKELALAAAEGEFADLDIDEDGISDDTVTLSGGEEVLLPGPSEGYEKQINAIKGLVAEDAGRVAQVVKQWVMDSDD